MCNMFTILKRFKQFCPLINSSEIAHPRKCAQNFVKIDLSVWSIAWSHTHILIHKRQLSSLFLSKRIRLTHKKNTVVKRFVMINGRVLYIWLTISEQQTCSQETNILSQKFNFYVIAATLVFVFPSLQTIA